ncbi:MAG TPA: hopanoid biosynthesis-associated protein HpnK [Thermodesulfovibrionia bacterium]|nr:hopanoid biosynthesis-associated protein HpnK [Thermodesulfovibrionia bacterium]
MARYLIVNGDDFGSCKAINKGIVLAHENGILTSASLMAGGREFDEAVAIAKAHPNLGVGIHLTLILGKSVLPPQRLSGLVDREGNFTTSPVQGGFRYFFLKSMQPSIRDEMEAQIEKVLNSGITPTHVDGHLNIHLHPVVLNLLVPLLEKYKIQAVRVPKEHLMIHLKLNNRKWFSMALHAGIFTMLGKKAGNLLKHRQIRFPDQTFGLLQSGAMTSDFLKAVLPQLPDGITEMGFHAAYGMVDKESEASGYRYEEELSALTAAETKALVKSEGIKLINYGNIV